MQFLKAPTAILCALTLYVNVAFAMLTPCCCQRTFDGQQSKVACSHCVTVVNCCVPDVNCGCHAGDSCAANLPSARCACDKSLPTIFQSLDTQKRFAAPAMPDALQPFLSFACAATDLSGLRDKSSKAVPLHGPPLLAFLCIWLN